MRNTYKLKELILKAVEDCKTPHELAYDRGESCYSCDQPCNDHDKEGDRDGNHRDLPSETKASGYEAGRFQ